MARTRDALIWGLVFLVVGSGFLLWNFGLFEEVSGTAELVVAGFFALIGLGFLVAFLMTRANWWRLIPGFVLLSVGAVIFLGTRDVAAEWLGVTLFAGLALAFAVIYASNRQEQWWALILVGTMAVLAVMVLLSGADLDEKVLGAALFGGMALVFLLVYLLAADRGAFRWALVPAGSLLLMSFVALTAWLSETNPEWEPYVRVWPILLIFVGLLLLALYITRSRRQPQQAEALSPEPTPEEAPVAPGTSIHDFDESPPVYLPPIERAPIMPAGQLPMLDQAGGPEPAKASPSPSPPATDVQPEAQDDALLRAEDTLPADTHGP